MIIRKSKIREMQDLDIVQKIDELKLELSKEKSKIKIGGFPENPGKIKELRRTVARMETIRIENKSKKKGGTN